MVSHTWSREAVLREILSLHGKGSDLRHNVAAAANSRLVSAAVRYFGSWGAAVSAAGIDYAGIRRESQSARAEKITKWSKERIDEQVKELVSSGEPLGAATVRTNHPALFSAAVSPRYYGSWRATLTAVGVDYDALLDQSRSSSRPDTDVRAARAMARKLKAIGRDHQPPTETEAQSRYPRLYRRAIHRFGSWEAALIAALGILN